MAFLLNHVGPVDPGGILLIGTRRSRPNRDQGGLRAWGQCSGTSAWARFDTNAICHLSFISHLCLSKYGLVLWGTFYFQGALNGTPVRGMLGLRWATVIQANGTDVDCNGICDLATGIQKLDVGLLYQRHLPIPCQCNFQFGHLGLPGVHHITNNGTQKWISSWWEEQWAIHQEEQGLTCQLHDPSCHQPQTETRHPWCSHILPCTLQPLPCLQLPEYAPSYLTEMPE